MKKTEKIRRKTFGSIVLGALLLIGFTGCVKSPDTDGPGKGDENLPVFNFSTKATYPLNVKYTVPEGYKVFFEVYASDPFTTDANGKQVKNTALEPIGKGYTDTKGNYSHSITLPAYVQTLYIYSPNAGVPELMTCRVENGVLTAAALPERSATATGTTKAPNSRVDRNVSARTIYTTTTKVLGEWESYGDGYYLMPNNPSPELQPDFSTKQKQAKLWGRPLYMAYVDKLSFDDASAATESAITVSANIWNTINTVLPGTSGESVDKDILKNGDIHVTQEAEISLYLLDERGQYFNTLAYYCYPTGQAPASPDQIKAQVIALPNAKIIRTHGLASYAGTIEDYGALCQGEGVKLKYVDAQGNLQDKFPAGVSIGWVLYADGFSNGYNTRTQPRFSVSSGVQAIYSDPNLNANKAVYGTVFRHGDFVITSFEDSPSSDHAKNDYDDVIFHVGSTPASAITPGIPDKDPDQPKEYDVIRRGILSFEDNWPYTGDFDMNDVVIKYVSTVKYNNDNEAISTNDVFTVLWSGAKYNNSFAYENANIARGLKSFVTADDAVKYSSVDPQNGNIIRVAPKVLDYANQGEKKTFSFNYEYATPIPTDNFVLPPYNPFITVGDDQTREVHLTNMQPTSIADPKYLGMGNDRSNSDKSEYFITYDETGNQMPFAIDITFDNEEGMNGYVIPKELKRINTYYSGFMNWIKTGGKENTDWYLHPSE